MKNKKASPGLRIKPDSLAPPCPMTCALNHSATKTHMVLIVGIEMFALCSENVKTTN